MCIYKKYTEANRDKDAEALLDLVNDDFTFVSHAHAVTGNREQFASMIYFLMGRGKTIKVEHERCLYENEDILVEHKIMSFPDSRREAVMSVWIKKDGKLASLETGATPLI